MKKLKYIQYLIFKEWLPIIVLFLSIMLIILFSLAASRDFYRMTYPQCITQGNVEGISISWLALAIVMSFVVFSYRFSTRKSDMYYQVPLKSGELKNIRLLTGLFCLVAVMFITFIIPYLFLLLRYYASPETLVVHSDYGRLYDQTFSKLPVNFGMMFVTFLVALGLTILEYFISAFFFSLCHKPASSIIINVSFHIFIAFIFFALFNTLGSRLGDPTANTEIGRISSDFSNTGFSYFEYSPGFVMAARLPNLLYQGTVFGGYVEVWPRFFDSEFSYVFFWIQVGMSVFLGSGAAVLLFFKKEKSGELCNNYGFVNKKLNYLLFITMVPIVICFASCSTLANVSFYVLYIIIGGLYYFLFAWFSGTFKVQKFAYLYIGLMVFILFTASPFIDAITGASIE